MAVGQRRYLCGAEPAWVPVPVMVPMSPQGSLEDDGRIIDTSLSRDPLQVELGKRQVIPGEHGGPGGCHCLCPMGVGVPPATPAHPFIPHSSQAWSRVCWTCVWGKLGNGHQGCSQGPLGRGSSPTRH